MAISLPPSVRRLARLQRGLLTREQLLAAGVTSATLSRWLHREWLVTVFAGVYALPGVTLDAEVRAKAALLRVGDGAVVAGPAAARLHGLRPFRHYERVELLVPRGRRVRPRGVDVRTTETLQPGDRTQVRSISVLTVARSVIDLCGIVTEAEAGEALADALVQNLLRPRDFELVVDRLCHIPGIVVARALRDGLYGDEGAFRSQTEHHGATLLVRSGYPRPLINHVLRCRCGAAPELDLYLESDGVDVELDGPHHALPGQQRRDRVRDRHLSRCAGIEVVRWPARRLWSDSSGFLAAVNAGVSRARAHLQRLP